jgi:hypothetical protein
MNRADWQKHLDALREKEKDKGDKPPKPPKPDAKADKKE